MSLGKHIKKFRAQKDMSQPQLAELAGIEQSYLSKLENDKSVPSNEIFRSLLNALQLTLNDFMQAFGPIESHDPLLQIADINHWFKAKQRHKLIKQRRFIYACGLLLVIGASLFYTGISKKLFSEVHYQYQSSGVIKANEPDNIFSSWRYRLDSRDSEKISAKRLEMDKRRDEKYLISSTFRGEEFVDPVPNARRLYHLEKEKQIERPINAWLEVIGVFIFSMGIVGFVIEKKLYHLSYR